MFSAKKVAGERLYRAAREGREVERTPVSITVHSLDLIVPPADAEDGTRSFAIRVKCSSGTYVRTLAHDIGARLGVGAHLSELRRTAVGPFGIEAAFKLEELEARRDEGTLANVVVSPSEMLAHLPSVNLSAEGIEAITHGRSVETELRQSEPAVRICDENGDLVAVGSFDVESRRLKPRIVLIQTS
jgi:tRNA pseudouridine55 synthase